MSLLDIFIIALLLAWISFLIFILVSRASASRHGAPYIGMSRSRIHDLLEFGGLRPSDHLLDLGCGDARVLVSALQSGLAARATGYEIARWPYLKAWIARRTSRLEGKLTLYRAHLDQADLSHADFIYLYLFPELLQQVATKAGREARVGTKILTPGFAIDTTTHSNLRLVKEGEVSKMKVYLYEVTRD